MSKHIERLQLKDLKIDKGTQPRVTLDQGVIGEYTDLILDALKNTEERVGSPANIPWVVTKDLPVVFRDEAGHCYLADGFHRYFAHKNAKLKEIDVEIIPGTLRDAQLYSVGVNAAHGVRRTQKDKRRAVQVLLNDKEWSQWSDNEIAKRANVSGPFVAGLRPVTTSPSTRKATRKGKAISVKTGKIGTKSGKTKSDTKDAAAPNLKSDTVLKSIHKITTAIGGELGGAVRKGIESGSLKMSTKDLKDWSGTSEARIRKTAPLVTELGFTPAKALAFLDRDVNASSKVDELINHSLARGGQYEIKVGGYLITVLDSAKYSAEIKHK